MKIADLSQIEGRRYPAGRRTQNIVGGASPLQATNFCLGMVTLDPHGGQVPWHNHDQEEVYVILEGSAEICVGDECGTISAGQTAYIPSGTHHQLTNLSDVICRMIYCFGPAGEVAHWRQELEGTLPRAGGAAPPLPAGASPQKC